MFKFLKIGLLAVVLSLSLSVSANAIEKSKIDSIVNYVKDLETGEYNGFTVFKEKELLFRSTANVTWLRAEENTTSHDYFKVTWRLHVLKVYHVPGALINHYVMRILFRNYRDCLSVRTRQYEEWWMLDVELDGLIGEHEKYYTGREFVIIACENDGEDCRPNWILSPTYPAGFRNPGWYRPSLETVQEQYDTEINYWLQVIWGKEE